MPHRPHGPASQRRIRNVRLVSVFDPGYHAYLARLKAETYTLREKRPPTASWLVAGIAEKAVRVWLSRNATLTDNRVLAYQVQTGRYGYRDAYRELDVVAIDPATSEPTCVYEIKCSRRPSILASAAGQVRSALSMLERFWPSLVGCVVYVDFSRGRWGLELGRPVEAASGGGVVLPPGRAGRMATWYRVGEGSGPMPRTSAVPGVVYSIVDRQWVRALATELGLLPDPELWARAEQEEEPPDTVDEEDTPGSPRRPGGPGGFGPDDEPWVYSTDSEGEPVESPLAQALREAGLVGEE